MPTGSREVGADYSTGIATYRWAQIGNHLLPDSPQSELQPRQTEVLDVCLSVRNRHYTLDATSEEFGNEPTPRKHCPVLPARRMCKRYAVLRPKPELK